MDILDAPANELVNELCRQGKTNADTHMLIWASQVLEATAKTIEREDPQSPYRAKVLNICNIIHAALRLSNELKQGNASAQSEYISHLRMIDDGCQEILKFSKDPNIRFIRNGVRELKPHPYKTWPIIRRESSMTIQHLDRMASLLEAYYGAST